MFIKFIKLSILKCVSPLYLYNALCRVNAVWDSGRVHDRSVRRRHTGIYTDHHETHGNRWTTSCSSRHARTHTHKNTTILLLLLLPFYGSLDFVRDNPGEPVPGETFTHSHLSWSSIIPICFQS